MFSHSIDHHARSSEGSPHCEACYHRKKTFDDPMLGLGGTFPKKFKPILIRQLAEKDLLTTKTVITATKKYWIVQCFARWDPSLG